MHLYCLLYLRSKLRLFAHPPGNQWLLRSSTPTRHCCIKLQQRRLNVRYDPLSSSSATRLFMAHHICQTAKCFWTWLKKKINLTGLETKGKMFFLVLLLLVFYIVMLFIELWRHVLEKYLWQIIWYFIQCPSGLVHFIILLQKMIQNFYHICSCVLMVSCKCIFFPDTINLYTKSKSVLAGKVIRIGTATVVPSTVQFWLD